ncbi:MAG: energy transducer TonB, partial [Marinirhabdus sp.]|nr:energy transducer TonB [Marinirhabdus sp.]
MSLLDTEHKKKSMTITVILHVLLLILLFYVGMTYLDPPPENGIAVNFGTTDTGSGDVQPREPIKSAPAETTPPPTAQPKT